MARRKYSGLIFGPAVIVVTVVIIALVQTRKPEQEVVIDFEYEQVLEKFLAENGPMQNPVLSENE